MKTLFFSLASALALTACATTPVPQPSAKAFVVRHFEKEGGSDPSLTQAGQARAEALAQRLSGERIVAVFSTDTLRTKQSATPTARQYGLPVTSYAPTDYAALAQRIGEARGSVLVVGHSNTVPEIVATLSGTPQPPIDESQFGTVFVVDLATRGVTAEPIGN